MGIYPATNKALRPTTPVRGPDIYGSGKYWSLVGQTGEKFTVRLQVWEGEITVTTSATQYGTRQFNGSRDKDYYVTRQGYRWEYEKMNSKGKDVYTMEFHMNSDGYEVFQIAVDMNSALAIYPEMPMASQLMSLACGPDSKGDGLHWTIMGAPGATMEITLDLAQKDKTAMVTWEQIKAPPSIST